MNICRLPLTRVHLALTAELEPNGPNVPREWKRGGAKPFLLLLLRQRRAFSACYWFIATAEDQRLDDIHFPCLNNENRTVCVDRPRRRQSIQSTCREVEVKMDAYLIAQRLDVFCTCLV